LTKAELKRIFRGNRTLTPPGRAAAWGCLRSSPERGQNSAQVFQVDLSEPRSGFTEQPRPRRPGLWSLTASRLGSFAADMDLCIEIRVETLGYDCPLSGVLPPPASTQAMQAYGRSALSPSGRNRICPNPLRYSPRSRIPSSHPTA
jgi:hypothetical protein